MLTPAEKIEFQQLHEMVYHIECFGSKDVMRESDLYSKAEENQILDIYRTIPTCYCNID